GAPIPTAGWTLRAPRPGEGELSGSTTERAGGLSGRRGTMTGDELKILILAGRLSRYDARWPLAPWLDRLERRGCRSQVLCLSQGSVLAHDPRCYEVAALGNPWMRGLTARSLWSSDGLQRPDLMHVIHDEMSEAALAISESSQLPYVQTVAD